jgi:hypothetical protein
MVLEETTVAHGSSADRWGWTGIPIIHRGEIRVDRRRIFGLKVVAEIDPRWAAEFWWGWPI